MHRFVFLRPAVVSVMAVGLMMTAGCGTLDPRTSNQGGGNVISAGSKVAAGELTSLTPDEVQILGDTLSTFVPDAPNVNLTDEQADVILQVLQDNNINTIDDAVTLAQNPQDAILPDEFIELFGDMASEDFEALVQQ